MYPDLFIQVGILAIIAFAFFIYNYIQFKGRLYFLLSGLSIAVWISAALMEIKADTLYGKTIWTSITWIGAGGVSASYFFFVYEFLLGRDARKLYPTAVIFFSSFLPAVLGATSFSHGLFFGYETYLVERDSISYAVFERNILWYFFAIITHSYVLAALSLLLIGIAKSEKYFQPQIISLLFAASIPLFFNLSYIFFDLRINNYNFTPFSFLISFLLIAGIVYLGRSFNIETVSADKLFHDSRNPAIITDKNNQVFSYNSSMEKLIKYNKIDPLHMCELIRKVDSTHKENPEINMKNETFLINHITINAPVKLGENASIIGHTYQLIDITHQKELENKFRTMSETDWLTKVSSRGHFMDTLEVMRKRSSLGIFILDLDFFKKINDQFGHDGGDKVLVEVGKTLVRICGGWQTTGRIGGEEFILSKIMETQDDLEIFAQYVCESIRQIDLTIDETKISLTGSVGAVLLQKGGDVGKALKAADVALYKAKASGRNRYVIGSIENDKS